jgi:hypothetical protein
VGQHGKDARDTSDCEESGETLHEKLLSAAGRTERATRKRERPMDNVKRVMLAS